MLSPEFMADYSIGSQNTDLASNPYAWMVTFLVISMWSIFFAVGVAVYWSPTIVACIYKHPYLAGIAVLNTFLGITLVGWAVALAWAFTKPQTSQSVIVNTSSSSSGQGRFLRMKVEIYGDGACIKNPGPGGYGTIVICGNDRQEFGEGFRWTTNNRMEILSIIAGLRILPNPSHVTIVSDSKYVIDAIHKGWIRKWKRKGWVTSQRKSVLNIDLWLEMDALMSKHKVTPLWVKGHGSGMSKDTVENNRCHNMAERNAHRSAIFVDEVYEAINPISHKGSTKITKVALSE